MSMKAEYLEFHGLLEGTPEGERAWSDKLAMMQGKRFFSAPMIFVSPDIRYDSPIDGRHITNLQARQEDLARSGCIPYDPEMKKDSERRRVEADLKLEAMVDETVEREVSKMPSRKLEQLNNELAAGADLEPVRRSVNGT